jgi:hypothetical protein
LAESRDFPHAEELAVTNVVIGNELLILPKVILLVSAEFTTGNSSFNVGVVILFNCDIFKSAIYLIT